MWSCVTWTRSCHARQQPERYPKVFELMYRREANTPNEIVPRAGAVRWAESWCRVCAIGSVDRCSAGHRNRRIGGVEDGDRLAACQVSTFVPNLVMSGIA
jgi:hypothetical protein